MRNAVSLAGDADTLAAIAGELAEVLCGIPEEIGRPAWSYVPEPMRKVIVDCYSDGPREFFLSRSNRAAGVRCTAGIPGTVYVTP